MLDNPSVKRLLVKPLDMIEEAARVIDDFPERLAIVVAHGDKLVGTVSDGDIRRGLLRGVWVDSPIVEIMQSDPVVVCEGESQRQIMDLMMSLQVSCIPEIDADGKVVRVHCRSKCSASSSLQDTDLIIMAGGRGSRLRPLTDGCPKPMLTVRGKPILEHIIHNAANEGFQRFFISVHYLGSVIEEHFGDGTNFGVSIEYLKEESPLGTAGALGNYRSGAGKPFLVMNGDIITDVRLRDVLAFHKENSADATMVVRSYEMQNPFGVVDVDGIEIIDLIEKPVYQSYVNAGVYVLSKSLLDLIPSGEFCDMPSLFSSAKDHDLRTIAFPMHESWVDVGRTSDLAKANSLI